MTDYQSRGSFRTVLRPKPLTPLLFAVAVSIMSCETAQSLIPLSLRLSPGPGLYPGAAVTPYYSSSVCDHIRLESVYFDYSVPIPIQVAEAYFSEQMGKFCQEPPHFEEHTYLYNRCDANVPCRYAECTLNGYTSEYVHIWLQETGPSKTRVMQDQELWSPSALSPQYCGE